MYKFKNKIALITGSTRGIGLEIAKNLKQKECKIIFNSRKNINLNKKDLFRDNHFGFDCTKEKEVIKGLKKIRKKFKKVDFLVCNVGSSKINSNKSGSAHEWQRMIEKNLFSSIIVIENFLKYFKQNVKIICISSVSGNYISKAPIEYIVSKSALNTYVKKKSKLIGENNTINCLAPGNILSKGGRWEKKLQINKKSVMKQIKESVPLNRFGKTSEIANMVSFILSDYSNFLNGSVISIDGGQNLNI